MTKTIILESTFIKSAIGVIYRMAPYHRPRKIDEIVDHIHHEFTTRGKKVLDIYYFEYNQDEVYKLVEEILKTCPAFNELNLSQSEVDRGIGLEDENRPPFTAVSRYTTIQDYYDFIDLDACVRNIVSDLYWDWLDWQLSDNKAEIIFKSGAPANKTYNDLAANVRQWATDRGLHKGAPEGQLIKLMEEVGELAGAVARNKEDLIKDSIGDIMVVLEILCMRLGYSPVDCFRGAYEEIANRKGKTVNGIFVKEE